MSIIASDRRCQPMLGRTFGRWKVISHAPRRKGVERVNCVCSCGTAKDVDANSVQFGKSSSCGCYNRESAKARATTHGEGSKRNGESSEYKSWLCMVWRCSNPSATQWKWYGGRGITVCERWRNSFPAFLADMGRKPTPKHTIERLNSDGNYEPANCVWATKKQQMRNTSRNRYVTHEGVTCTVAEWAERTGIPAGSIYARLYEGWSHSDAVTRPNQSRPHRTIN